MKRSVAWVTVMALMLVGTLGGYQREAAAADDATYLCAAAGPGLAVAAEGLTKEEAKVFKATWKARGATLVKCQKFD